MAIKLSPVNYKRAICSVLTKGVARFRMASLIPRPPYTWETYVGSQRNTNRRAKESPEGEDRHFGRRHGHDDPGATAGRSGVSRFAIFEAPARPARQFRRAKYP